MRDRLLKVSQGLWGRGGGIKPHSWRGFPNLLTILLTVCLVYLWGSRYLCNSWIDALMIPAMYLCTYSYVTTPMYVWFTSRFKQHAFLNCLFSCLFFFSIFAPSQPCSQIHLMRATHYKPEKRCHMSCPPAQSIPITTIRWERWDLVSTMIAQLYADCFPKLCYSSDCKFRSQLGTNLLHRKLQKHLSWAQFSKTDTLLTIFSCATVIAPRATQSFRTLFVYNETTSRVCRDGWWCSWLWWSRSFWITWSIFFLATPSTVLRRVLLDVLWPTVTSCGLQWFSTHISSEGE